MFTLHSIDFRKSGVLSGLALDYLEKKKELGPFYTHFPDKEGFENLLREKNYIKLDRKMLANILLEQSKKVNNTSAASETNIQKLAGKNVYTITTGHQLCLFTGPLYFIYKIFSAINLAEELKKRFPACDFVPVYWMASEDHDFEEVNHFNLFGKKIEWISKQGGPVGSFKTSELHTLLPFIKETFGNGQYANELALLFESAYLKHNTLAEATHYLVNELFGEYGLVVVDGNNAQLKQQFIPQFKRDILSNDTFESVSKTITQLNHLGYDAQVTPRRINCFYIEPGKRLRIEKNNGVYNLVGSNRIFSESEMYDIIQHYPEAISPNVVLRPLYQQTILPNVAYVGGPGELAYWFEYKSLFDAFGLFMPVLVPRNFILVIDKATHNKIHKLGFKVEDFFKSETELINMFRANTNTVFELNQAKNKLHDVYAEVTEKISGVEKTLTVSVSAELQKALNSLEMLSAKANKALKQRSETELNQIKGLKQKLFPSGAPQERNENFSTFYLKYGKGFFEALKKNVGGLDMYQKILVEE